MNDSFKLKQRQKQQIRRLEKICFKQNRNEDNDSPSYFKKSSSVKRSYRALQMRQECDRILKHLPPPSPHNQPTIRDQLKLTLKNSNNLQRNMQKHQSLQRNFQKFTDRFTNPSFRQLASTRTGQQHNQTFESGRQHHHHHHQHHHQQSLLSALDSNKENSLSPNILIGGQEMSPIQHHSNSFTQHPIGTNKQHCNNFSLNQSLNYDTTAIHHNSSTMLLQQQQSAIGINRICDQIGVFFNRTIHGMIQMSVTNSQEIELRKKLNEYLESVEKFRQAINSALMSRQKGIQNERGEYLFQRDASLAFEELVQAFEISIGEMSDKFSSLLLKIQGVSSSSFQRYKMRDICNLFEQLGEQFNRLHVLDFLPILSEKWTRLRQQNGFVILDKVLELYNNRNKRIYFKRWQEKQIGREQRQLNFKRNSAARMINMILSHHNRHVMSNSLITWASQISKSRCSLMNKRYSASDAINQLYSNLVQNTPNISTLFKSTRQVLNKFIKSVQNEQFPVECELIIYDQVRRLTYTYSDDANQISYRQSELDSSILGNVIAYREIYNNPDACRDQKFNPLIDSSSNNLLKVKITTNTKSGQSKEKISQQKYENLSLLYFPIFNKHKQFSGVIKILRQQENKELKRFSQNILENVSEFSQALGGIIADYTHTIKQYSYIQNELVTVTSRNSTSQNQLKRSQQIYELFYQASNCKNRNQLFQIAKKGSQITFQSGGDIELRIYAYENESDCFVKFKKNLKKQEMKDTVIKPGMKNYQFLNKCVKCKKSFQKRESKIMKSNQHQQQVFQAKIQEQVIFTACIPIMSTKSSLQQGRSVHQSFFTTNGNTSSVIAVICLEKCMSLTEAEKMKSKRFFLPQKKRKHTTPSLGDILAQQQQYAFQQQKISPQTDQTFFEDQQLFAFNDKMMANFNSLIGCITLRLKYHIQGQTHNSNNEAIQSELATLKTDNILLAKRLQLAQEFEDEINICFSSGEEACSPSPDTNKSFDELQKLLFRLFKRHFPQTAYLRLFIRSMFDQNKLISLQQIEKYNPTNSNNVSTNAPLSNNNLLPNELSKDGSMPDHRKINLNKNTLHSNYMYNTTTSNTGRIMPFISSKPQSQENSFEIITNTLNTNTQIPPSKMFSTVPTSRLYGQNQNEQIQPRLPNISDSGLTINSSTLQDSSINIYSVDSLVTTCARNKQLLNVPQIQADNRFQPLVDLPQALTYEACQNRFSTLLLPILSGNRFECLIQLISVSSNEFATFDLKARNLSSSSIQGYAEEDQFVIAAISQKLRGVISNERKHNAETMKLRSKLETTELQLNQSSNINQTLLAMNTFISTQVPCKSLPSFIVQSNDFLQKLFNCERVKIMILDEPQKSLISYSQQEEKKKVIDLQNFQSAINQKSSQIKILVKTIENGTVIISNSDNQSQPGTNTETLNSNDLIKCRFSDDLEEDRQMRQSIRSLLQVRIDLDSCEEDQQGERKKFKSKQTATKIGLIQLINRRSLYDTGRDVSDFSSYDIGLLQLVSQSLAPTLNKLRCQLQEVSQRQCNTLIQNETCGATSKQRIGSLKLVNNINQIIAKFQRYSLNKLNLKRRNELILSKFVNRLRNRRIFRAFNIFRRKTFEKGLKQQALKVIFAKLSSSQKINQYDQAKNRKNQSFSSHLSSSSIISSSLYIPAEFQAISSITPIISRLENRLVSRAFRKWSSALQESSFQQQSSLKRMLILRQLTRASHKRQFRSLFRKRDKFFSKWQRITKTNKEQKNKMRSIFRHFEKKFKSTRFQQWQRFTLGQKLLQRNKSESKTKALKKFLRMKRQLRIKTQGFAVSRWLNMTKNYARKQLERHREESMTLQQAHRHQNFVNTLYQCSCFFAQSQNAGFKQYVQENSLGSLLESPQVRSFFKIIKNYLCMQYEFEQCVITMKIPSQSSLVGASASIKQNNHNNNKFFMIKFINNPLMDISCGQAAVSRGGEKSDQDLLLFSSRNHSRDQISQLMRDVQISEISHRSGDKSPSSSSVIDLIDPQQDEFIKIHLKQNQNDSRNRVKVLNKMSNNKRYSDALQVRDINKTRSILLGPINLKTIVRHPYAILQESKNRDENQSQQFQELIGSIQLYSSTNQFQNELEIKQFSQLCEAISPCMLSFITAIRNTLSSDNVLFPLKNIKTSSEEQDYFVKLHSCASLSSLSRFFISNPEIFQGASKALLIHLPFYTADQQRMAFFYSFEDCHIYNFQYSASFIDQIILTHLPLTFSESKSLSEQSSSNASTYNYIRYLPILSNSPTGQYIGKNQELSSANNGIKNALRSITRSNPNLPSVIAILELCHEPINKAANSKILLHNAPQEISQCQLEVTRVTGIHLQGLRSRVKNFVILLTKFDSVLQMKSINSKFQKWKRILHAIKGQKQAKITKGKMSTIQSQIHQIQGSMVQYSETIQNYQDKISHMEQQLNQSYENREKLSKDLDSMKREKRAKLKFLAASLIFGQMQGVICGVMRMKNAFQIWKADSTCMKIAQNAFNKVLQLNHKHAGARFDTAFFLMSRFRKKFNDRMVYFSFRSIAHHQAVVYDCGSKVLASHSGVFGAKYQNELQQQQQHNQKFGGFGCDMIITPNKIQRNQGSIERRNLNVNLQQIKPQHNNSSNNSLYSTSKENYLPPSPYLTPNTRKEGGRSAGRKSQTKRSTSGKRIY